MNMTSPFQSIAAATIPSGAMRIKEIETEITLDFIHVTPLIGAELDDVHEVGKTISLRHGPFHDWLEENDRLTFESNSADHTGTHVQVQHEMSYTDYIKSPPITFNEDLIDYLRYTGKITMPYMPQI